MDTIDVHARIDRIDDERRKQGLTMQQLADGSKVPIQTVSRIISHKTDNPGFAAMMAMEMCLGITDELQVPPAPEPTGDKTADLVALYRYQLALNRKDYEERITTQRREFRMIESMNRRSINLLTLVLLIVSALLFGVLFYDILHGGFGLFRYEQAFHWLPHMSLKI
jgi:transcriptional regulator with XRE-family HTH domain